MSDSDIHRKRILSDRSEQAVTPQTVVTNQHGQSIIQVLISIGLMGVLMAAFATMMSNQSQETRALSEKLAALDLQQLLTASLADGSVCQYVLNNPTVLTFDSTKPLPQTITLPDPDVKGNHAALYTALIANPAPPPAQLPGPVAAQVSKPASAASNSLLIQSIQLQIVGGGGGSYSGNWIVNFDSSKTVRAIKPVTVATKLTADTTIPTQATITSCQSGSASPSQLSCTKVITSSAVINITAAMSIGYYMSGGGGGGGAPNGGAGGGGGGSSAIVNNGKLVQFAAGGAGGTGAAAGLGSPGKSGSTATGSFTVAAGDTVNVYVGGGGGGGYYGSGNSAGGGGGSGYYGGGGGGAGPGFTTGGVGGQGGGGGTNAGGAGGSGVGGKPNGASGSAFAGGAGGLNSANSGGNGPSSGNNSTCTAGCGAGYGAGGGAAPGVAGSQGAAGAGYNGNGGAGSSLIGSGGVGYGANGVGGGGGGSVILTYQAAACTL